MALAQQLVRQEDPQLVALRVPPHSVEAEQSLLGGLLLDNQAFDRIADLVSGADFYRDDHRRIWRHISKLVEAGKPADVVTVSESIEASEDKDKTGGAAYLGALAQNTPSALNIRRYAELVRERAVQRRLAQVATEIAENALSPSGKDVGQILDEAESRILELVGGDFSRVTAQTVYDAAHQGDDLALEVVRDTARYLGAGVANMINVFNPEVVVICGGVTLAGERLFAPLRQEVARRAFKPAVQHCRIVPGELTGTAGVYGAAASFLQLHADGRTSRPGDVSHA